MKFFRNDLALFTVLVAACLLVTGCRQKQTEDEDSKGSGSKATVAVKVAQVVERDAILTVEGYGKTDALHKEKVYTPTAGKIVSLKVNEGTALRKGDVIAVVQTKESQATILGAEMMLKKAVSEEQKAEAERTLKLATSGAMSVSVTAKFEGVVATRSVSEGELVTESAELVTIIDLSTIDFQADILLKDLPQVRLGQRATVHIAALAGREFSATVEAINPQSDVQSQTVKVRLAFPSTGDLALLRTDMMGTARIVTGVRPRALFVPKVALLRNDEENTCSVVTITQDSLSTKIPVMVGVVDDSTAEIRSSGLHAGSVVITEGHYALPDSTHVARVE